MANRSLFMVITAVGFLFGQTSALAVERCVDNPESGPNRPDICVDWDLTGQPILGLDFDVFFADLANPDVTLARGAAWNVRSKDDAGNPANIGDIKIDATVVTDSFDLAMTDNIGGFGIGGPGAVNVGAILLSDPNPNWTGFSSITTGQISGDLAGDLIVVKDSSGNGGDLTLTIDGDAGGNINAPGALTLSIGGDALGNIDASFVSSLYIGTLTAGTLLKIGETGADPDLGCSSICIDLVNGDVEIGKLSGEFWASEVTGDVTIDLLTGWVNFLGDVTSGSVVTIKDMQHTNPFPPIVWINTSPIYDFIGTLNLLNGVPISSVYIKGDAPLTTVVDFGDDGQKKDLVGQLAIENTFAGRIENINRLIGIILFAQGAGTPPNFEFSGTITMETLEGAIIALTASDITGDINVLGNMTGDFTTNYDVSGNLLVGGLIAGGIDITGDFSGNICAANVSTGGPLPPNINVGSIGPNPETGNDATLCSMAIECLVDTDCPDEMPPNGCTADLCFWNRCWHPQNGTCGVGAPIAAERPHHITPKNRYLTFDPNNQANVALEVELTVGPGTLGVLGWVGAPDVNGRSLIEPAPYFPTTTTWPGVVVLGDCGIVPDATYEIRATVDETNFTLPLTISTIAAPEPKFWGDVVGSLVAMDPLNPLIYRWSDPDGVTNFMDVQAIILGFQEIWKGSDVTWLDVHPEVPNLAVNANDWLIVIKAFQGDPYPFSDPSGCSLEGAAGGGSGPMGPLTSTNITMTPDTDLINADDLVNVDVFIDAATDLAVYETSLEVTGGDVGSLDLESLTIVTQRQDYVFGTASVVQGLDMIGERLAASTSNASGVNVGSQSYLGTFSFRASSDAWGVFTVAFRGGVSTFLSDSNVADIAVSLGPDILIGVGVACTIDAHCDDSNPCTDDTCNNGTCSNVNNDANTCSDGNDCTDDVCISGTCVSTNDDTNTCSDGNDCTADVCVSGVCTSTSEPANTPCDDGLFCTKTDKCDGAGTCVGSESPCLPREPVCCELTDTCVKVGVSCEAT